MQGAGWSPITHPFATLTAKRTWPIPFDLHVLSTPPAFVLSQNRTLHRKTRKLEIRGAVERLCKHPLTVARSLARTAQKNRLAWNEAIWHSKKAISIARSTLSSSQTTMPVPGVRRPRRPPREQQDKTVTPIPPITQPLPSNTLRTLESTGVSQNTKTTTIEEENRKPVRRTHFPDRTRNWDMNRRQYAPCLASSSLCVPCSTMRPWSM